MILKVRNINDILSEYNDYIENLDDNIKKIKALADDNLKFERTSTGLFGSHFRFNNISKYKSFNIETEPFPYCCAASVINKYLCYDKQNLRNLFKDCINYLLYKNKGDCFGAVFACNPVNESIKKKGFIHKELDEENWYTAVLKECGFEEISMFENIRHNQKKISVLMFDLNKIEKIEHEKI